MQAKVAVFKLWKLPWLLKRILLHERCKNFSRDNALSVLSRLKWNALTFSNDNCATAETSTIQLPRVSRLACIFSRKINIRVAFALSLYLCLVQRGFWRRRILYLLRPCKAPRLEDSSSLTNRLYSNRVYSLQSSLLGFSFTAIGISLHLSSRLSRYYRRAKLRPSIDLSSRGEHRLAWILNWGERNIGLGWEYNFLIIPPLVSS